MFIRLAIRRRTYNFCNSYHVSVLYPSDVSRIHEENELKEVETQTPCLSFLDGRSVTSWEQGSQDDLWFTGYS